MPAEVGGMKVIRLIIIAIILTILVFPAGILIENYHPLNGLSWPMQFPNTQLNMVSNFSGPTNFKNILIYNGYNEFGNKFEYPYFFHEFINPPYVIYNDIFIDLGIVGNWNILNSGNSTYFNISIVATDFNHAIWNFTQMHMPSFELNWWSMLYITEPLVYRNTIYLTGTDGYLYALDLKGNFLWEKYLGPVFFTYIFPDNDYLYLFGLNFPGWNDTYILSGESIYKFNLINNEIVWNSTVNTWINLTTTSIYPNRLPSFLNNTLYLPLGNILYRINGSNGKIDVLGNYTFSFIHFVTIANNAIYGESNNSVVKINMQDGEIIWRYNVSYPSPCTVYKDKVVFATENGYTYALDAMTGKEIWRTNTHLGVGAAITITSNQIIYEGGSCDFYDGGTIIAPHIVYTFNGIVSLDLNDGKILDYSGYYSCYICLGDSHTFFEGKSLRGIGEYGVFCVPAFFQVIIPKDNVVIAGWPSNVYVGYIPYYYIWMASILIIWVPISIFIFHKRNVIKKDSVKN
jgi:outer membrane protein assembly factor BamB